MAGAQRKVLREVDEAAVRLARTLLRTARFGALAVSEPQTGWPMASRVGVATDPAGAPLILVSGLSAHTRALKADARVSLLLGEPGKGDPLAHPRITLICRAEVLERGTKAYEKAERRYLNRHPKAELYAGLGDFTMVRLVPERASLNGGFGRAYEMTASDVLIAPGPAMDALANMENGALQHMNADHRDAVALYATTLAKKGEGAWAITGLDLEGMDLMLGDETARVFFAEPLRLAEDLRRVLAGMAREARGT